MGIALIIVNIICIINFILVHIQLKYDDRQYVSKIANLLFNSFHPIIYLFIILCCGYFDIIALSILIWRYFH